MGHGRIRVVGGPEHNRHGCLHATVDGPHAPIVVMHGCMHAPGGPQLVYCQPDVQLACHAGLSCEHERAPRQRARVGARSTHLLPRQAGLSHDLIIKGLGVVVAARQVLLLMLAGRFARYDGGAVRRTVVELQARAAGGRGVIAWRGAHRMARGAPHGSGRTVWPWLQLRPRWPADGSMGAALVEQPQRAMGAKGNSNSPAAGAPLHSCHRRRQ